jgi:hypothetical protein
LQVLTEAVTASLHSHIRAVDARRGKAYETTNTTLARHGRRHFALSLYSPPVHTAVTAVAMSLHPLLCHTFGHGDATPAARDPEKEVELENEHRIKYCDAIRLVESGVLISTPGAPAQPLHTDTDAAHQWLEASAIKIQIAVRRVTKAMGPIEILPGTSAAPVATGNSPLPLPLPRGAVLLYDTRLWHRGGANVARTKGRSKQDRPIFYLTVLGTGGDPPAGLPYTISPNEAACFYFTANGLQAENASVRCSQQGTAPT